MKAGYSICVAFFLTVNIFISSCSSQKSAVAAGTPPATETRQAQEHAELSGTWEYIMTNDQQEPMTGLLTIQKGGNAGYTGSITLNGTTSENEMSINKAQLSGSNFIYEGEVITAEGNIPFTMKGTIQGRTLNGESTVVYKSRPVLWQVKATRK